MAEMIFDDSEFLKGMDTFVKRVEKQKMTALEVMADELLRLSQLEVPLDVSYLMQSGNVQKGEEEYLVGYNTDYAARLHEHPEYNFQKGRKGKYLEDPLKKNLKIFLRYFDKSMGEVYG